MKQPETLQRQLAALAAAYDAAMAAEQEQEEKYGPEPTGEGAVVAFRARFQKHGPRYPYAAVSAKGLWYTAGPKSPKGYSWAELTQWLDSLHKVTRFKVLDDGGKPTVSPARFLRARIDDEDSAW